MKSLEVMDSIGWSIPILTAVLLKEVHKLLVLRLPRVPHYKKRQQDIFHVVAQYVFITYIPD